MISLLFCTKRFSCKLVYREPLLILTMSIVYSTTQNMEDNGGRVRIQIHKREDGVVLSSKGWLPDMISGAT